MYDFELFIFAKLDSKHPFSLLKSFQFWNVFVDSGEMNRWKKKSIGIPLDMNTNSNQEDLRKYPVHVILYKYRLLQILLSRDFLSRL